MPIDLSIYHTVWGIIHTVNCANNKKNTSTYKQILALIKSRQIKNICYYHDSGKKKIILKQ